MISRHNINNIIKKQNMSSQLTVYKASAGSGKTFTLAHEYMTLIDEANPSFLQNHSCSNLHQQSY